jgi:hypothetical protein
VPDLLLGFDGFLWSSVRSLVLVGGVMLLVVLGFAAGTLCPADLRWEWRSFE